jgi:segregation and condensation protein B
MSHELDPKVGRWYRRVDDEQLFKVASIDEDDGLIEIKTVDGEVEELDSTEWVELDLETAEAPEDYVDPGEESEEDEADEVEKTKGPARGSRELEDDDEDDDDWDDDDDDDEDEDDDGDDNYDSDR